MTEVKAEPGGDVRSRLVDAAMRLLEREGPTAVKARTVAADAGLTTAAVYNHIGGMPELLRAVNDRGFALLGDEFASVPPSSDPATDVYALALRCREFAQASPHRYDLMFGLSARGSYRAAAQSADFVSGRSPRFLETYQHLLEACERLVGSGRVQGREPAVVAARLWAMVHGFISLELAHHFDDFDDAVGQILRPMAADLLVGMGDRRASVDASMAAARRKA